MYVGLSKKQLENLIAGEEVGKRPYPIDNIKFPDSKYSDVPNYEGDVRIFIRILSAKEEHKEHEGAFF